MIATWHSISLHFSSSSVSNAEKEETSKHNLWAVTQINRHCVSCVSGGCDKIPETNHLKEEQFQGLLREDASTWGLSEADTMLVSVHSQGGCLPHGSMGWDP